MSLQAKIFILACCLGFGAGCNNVPVSVSGLLSSANSSLAGSALGLQIGAPVAAIATTSQGYKISVYSQAYTSSAMTSGGYKITVRPLIQ